MRGIQIFTLIIFLMSFTSGISLETKSSFEQGETFYATLKGEIITNLNNQNVLFYRDNVNVPISISIIYAGETYYVSGQLIGLKPGNYSIEIRDLEYVELRETKKTTLKKNFTISESIADFLIQPSGLITDKDFEISIENLVSSSIDVSIKSSLSSNQDSLRLSSGEIKKVGFDISSISESSLQKIEISSSKTSYSIPIYISAKPIIPIAKMNFDKSELVVEMANNDSFNYSRIIYLKNTGNQKINEIYFSFSDSLLNYTNLSNYYIEILEPEESLAIGVFFIPTEETDFISGELLAQGNETYALISINLNITESYIPTTNDSQAINITPGLLTKSCSVLGGKICSQNQKCSGQVKASLEGNCCIGECNNIKNSEGNSRLVGIILLAIVIGFLGWFYFKKYKKVAPKVNLLKAASPRK